MTITASILSRPGERVAAIVGDRDISYRELSADIHRAATFLRAEGLGPGSIVAIYIGKFRSIEDYSTWVAHLAALRIGATHATLRAGPGLALLASATKLDAIIGRLPPESPAGTDLKIIPFDLESMPPADRSIDSEEQATRLSSTSGTTGVPKLIRWDSGLISGRVEQVKALGLIDDSTQLDCYLPPLTTAGFRFPLATWTAGGTVLLSESIPGPDGTRPAARSTLFVCSPFQLSHLMAQRRRWPNRVKRTIAVLGGRLPIGLRNWALANLADRIIISYGSTETGNVAFGDASIVDRHPGAVGWVREDAEASIVDDEGQAMQPGQLGRLRLRSRLMAGAGKPGDWFEPGDFALLFEDGLLAIHGRATDALNVGGLKLSAEELEARLVDADEIDDVGIIVSMAQNREVLSLAVVVAADVKPAELVQVVQRLLPASLPFRLIPVETVPRNAMGKVDRSELRKQLRARRPAARGRRLERA